MSSEGKKVQQRKLLCNSLRHRSCKLAGEIRSLLRGEIGQRICVVCPKGVGFVVAKWGIWMSGNVVVPVVDQHSAEAIEFFVRNSRARVMIGTHKSADKLLTVGQRNPNVTPVVLGQEYTANPVKTFTEPIHMESFDETFYILNSTSMILYAAGYSGKVRGLMYRHSNLNAQTDAVSKAWELQEKSSIMHSLPLNNSFGIVSSLMAPLNVGGRVVMFSNFDTVKVFL